MSETPVSQEAIYRARPIVRFAGEEDIRTSELILSMRMEENEGGMSTLELRLSTVASTPDGGAELAFDASSKLKLGASIEVYAGDEAQPREIFRGHVTAIEADFKLGSPPEPTLLAADAPQRARMARRSKTYADMAPADVARAIAGDLSLRPVIAGLASPTGTWAQSNASRVPRRPRAPPSAAPPPPAPPDRRERRQADGGVGQRPQGQSRHRERARR